MFDKQIQFTKDTEGFTKGEVLKRYWPDEPRYTLWKRDGAAICGFPVKYIQPFIDRGDAVFIN